MIGLGARSGELVDSNQCVSGELWTYISGEGYQEAGTELKPLRGYFIEAESEGCRVGITNLQEVDNPQAELSSGWQLVSATGDWQKVRGSCRLTDKDIFGYDASKVQNEFGDGFVGLGRNITLDTQGNDRGYFVNVQNDCQFGSGQAPSDTPDEQEGEEPSSTPTEGEQQAVEIVLKRGWNMIGLGNQGGSLRDPNECTTDKFFTYMPGDGYQEVEMELEPLHGYFVKAEREGCRVEVDVEGTAQQRSLQEGWNLIAADGEWQEIRNTCRLEAGIRGFNPEQAATGEFGDGFVDLGKNVELMSSNNAAGYFVKAQQSCEINQP